MYPAIGPVLMTAGAIVLVDIFRPPVWMLLFLLVLFTLLTAVVLRRRWRDGAATLVIFVIGLTAATHFAATTYATGPTNIERLVREPVRLTLYGRVDDWPRLHRERTDIVVAVDSITSDRWYRVSGRVLLQVEEATTALQRGDYVALTRRVYPLRERENLTGFDYVRYLRLRNIQAVAYLPTLLDVRVASTLQSDGYSIVGRIRDAILRTFDAALSDKASALAGGFLIGETRHIPDDVYEHFRNSGTLHLLAVSGSNVALVLLVVGAMLRPMRFRRVTETLALFGVIGLFVLLSYGEPSVVRAGLMATLVLIARLLGRKYDLNNIVALTALIILLVEPSQLFSIGFQLSFVTAWGLIFIVPRVTALFVKYHGRWWYRLLVFPFIIAATAQLCSTPLIALHFDRVPVWSVVANLLVVPMVSAAVVGVVLLLIAYAVLPVLGMLVGALVDPLMHGILVCLELFGGEGSWVVSTPQVSWLPVLATYGLLVLAAVSLKRRAWRPRLAIGTGLLINLVLVGMVWTELTIRQDKPVLFGVPGGVAMIRPIGGMSLIDLVITELHDTEYPSEERIISPILKRFGVERLRHLVVLAADHGAVDDLMRLASVWKADSLLYPELLTGIFGDLSPPADPAVRHRGFGRIDTATTMPSLCLSERTAMVFEECGVIVAAPRLDDIPRKFIGDRSAVLVISGLSGRDQRTLTYWKLGSTVVAGGWGKDRHTVHYLRRDGAIRLAPEEVGWRLEGG